MPADPLVKRAIAFFDGRNLFYAPKYAFGYSWFMTIPEVATRLTGHASGARLTMRVWIHATTGRRECARDRQAEYLPQSTSERGESIGKRYP